MKFYSTLELSKGYEVWKALFDKTGPQMRSIGLKAIYVGCEANNENKVHMIFEVPSLEPVKKLMADPEIHQKRVEAGVIVDSQGLIPLAD